MSKTSTSAQHYLECDNCEENPAKFLCKICAGHLCERCKSKHEKKKLTRNHEIVSLISNNEEMIDLLYCTKHTKKKLECYCNRCSKPVCTDCIIKSHKGHSVESLSKVYKEFTTCLNQQKEEIKTKLIPEYKSLLDSETAKKQALAKNADKIQKNIEKQTKRLIEMVKGVSEQRVQHLRKEEQKGHKKIDNTKNKIKEKLKTLEDMSTMIDSNLRARPSISFFNSISNNDLKMYRTFPTSLAKSGYIMTDFQPGNLKGDIEDKFGNWPELHRSGKNRVPRTIKGGRLSTRRDRSLLPVNEGRHGTRRDRSLSPFSIESIGNARDRSLSPFSIESVGKTSDRSLSSFSLESIGKARGRSLSPLSIESNGKARDRSLSPLSIESNGKARDRSLSPLSIESIGKFSGRSFYA